MADKFIDIEIENEEHVLRGIERTEERVERMAHKLVDDLSKLTESTLLFMVPRHNLYLFRHVDRSGPTWMPGGAGGGGEWKAIVGIKEGESRHPLYVEFGTGIYGGRGLIFARGVNRLTGHYQKVMVLEKEGTVNFRYWTRGQKPQRYMYLTWGILNALSRELIAEKRLIN